MARARRRSTSLGRTRRRKSTRRKTTGAGCKIEVWRGKGRGRVCRKRNGAIKSWKKVARKRR